MKKNKKLVMSLAALLLIGIIVGAMLYFNRGLPSSDVVSLKVPWAMEVATDASAKQVKSKVKVPNMRVVAETEQLSLWISDDTTDIALVDVKTGQIWYSTPLEADNDALATPYEKNMLRSQLIMQYFDREGSSYTFNNYEKSVANATFFIEELNDGVRVTYTLGDVSKGVDALPKYITVERFESKVLANLPEGTANYVRGRYMEMKDRPGIMERMDQHVEKQLVLNKMVAAFLEAGYTEEDLEFDKAENGEGSASGEEKPVFTIPVEYRLDADELVVSIPFSEVTEGTDYIIRSIDVLPFFGAAGLEDNGYMFVPDGTGSLIYLNNGKVKEEQYVQYVYGDDVNNNSRSRKMVSEPARMPVYGLKTENAAWLAQITKGDAISSITASISGMKNSYNNVFSTFYLRGEDWLELYTGSVYQEIKLLNDERFIGKGEVRYSVLTGKDASYAGMAKTYQQHLVEEGHLTKREDSSIPFYLDILGTYDHHAAFLGIPYKGISTMTTYEETEEIVSDFAAAGVSNIQLRFLGWFNEGLRHTTPTSIDLDRKVGSKKELQKLASTVKATGGQLFPDVAFNIVYEDDLSFTPSKDAARFVTREVVLQAPVNLNTNRMGDYLGMYYVLSPTKLNHIANKFSEDYSKLNLSGLSLRDLGQVLSSDYRVTRVIHRENSKLLVEDTLKQLQEKNSNLLMVGGHAYAWPYASHLIDVPYSSSRFNIADETVPFYQMVLHSYIPYAGESVNLADEQDSDMAVLRAIELGAYPHFTFTKEDSSELKFTNHTQYYSTQVDTWFEKAVKLYKEVKNGLESVAGAAMVDRIVHQDGVVEVKYDNGQSVLVNYTDEAVTIGRQTVEANSYAIGGER